MACLLVLVASFVAVRWFLCVLVQGFVLLAVGFIRLGVLPGCLVSWFLVIVGFGGIRPNGRCGRTVLRLRLRIRVLGHHTPW